MQERVNRRETRKNEEENDKMRLAYEFVEFQKLFCEF